MKYYCRLGIIKGITAKQNEEGKIIASDRVRPNGGFVIPVLGNF